MAKKFRLTRPELKRQRGAMARFERYLPMLQLKQQLLQIKVTEAARQHEAAQAEADGVSARVDRYRAVLRDPPGVNLDQLAQPSEVRTRLENIAGVEVPDFQSVSFAPATYSFFGTPPWVDRAVTDLRELAGCRARAEVLARRHRVLRAALTKIIQRVNLFEKVLIPQAREAIRVIRIRLGEEQTSAIGWAKLAKARLLDQGAGTAGGGLSPVGGGRP